MIAESEPHHQHSKRSVPAGLWTKCNKCQNIIYQKELKANFKICPKCGYYFRLNAKERIAQLLEAKSFKEIDKNLSAGDPLEFSDTQKYAERIIEEQKKTKLKEAVICGTGKIGEHQVVICALDFFFMGGSMGSVMGEKITRAIEKAMTEKLPLIIVSASGGARMQEGILSLMQMAKTTAALSRLQQAGNLFISVLADPTTGGVSASFALQGDILIAETKALIAFAGPRVIEQTIRQQLPEGFQQAEFLLQHGLVDMVVERKDLKDTILRVLNFLNSAAKKQEES